LDQSVAVFPPEIPMFRAQASKEGGILNADLACTVHTTATRSSDGGAWGYQLT